MSEGLSEFVYRLPGTSAHGKPGAHRSHTRGPGMSFVSHARLFDHPDPRRIDLRASISSVPRQWLVRSFKQRSSTSITVIADVSHSMHFAGAGTSKLSKVAKFVEALGYSAFRSGDRVSLQGFDQTMRDDIYLPHRSGRGTGLQMAEILRHLDASVATSGSSDGLQECAKAHIPGKTGLVFIASDFHWSLDTLKIILERFSGALVIPMVFWDPAETIPPTEGGLLNLQDMSHKRISSLWLTPKIRQQWTENVELRRDQLRSEFSKFDYLPFFVEGDFQAEALSKYFIENIV